MDAKVPRPEAVDDGFGSLLRCQQGRHGEVVLRAESGFYETGVDYPNANALRFKVEIKAFGKVNERGFSGAVAKSFGQPAIAGNAGDKGDSAAAFQVGKNSVGQAHRAAEVDVDHLLGARQIEGRCAHGYVVTGQIDRQINRPSVKSGFGEPCSGLWGRWHRTAIVAKQATSRMDIGLHT